MPVETRYYRSDSQTVNTVTAKILGLALSGTGGSASASDYSDTGADWYIGVRVYIVHVDGSKTELTGGTPAGVASIGHIGTWDCPQATLAPTDAILVEVYGLCNGTGWGPYSWHLLGTWVSEQLNTTVLNAATWTIHYYASVTNTYNKTIGAYTSVLTFYFDGSYPSRIENFTYGVAVVKRIIGDGFVWIMC